MKTKILSILLTVAMLVAMVPMIAVSAEEPTGTVYEVTDAASVTALIADTTKNVAGNTMKLTQDLTYEGWSDADKASVVSLWAGCKMHVDGNGHKVILKDGEYHNVILFNFAADVTELTVKNLAVVMEDEDAVAKSTQNEALALFGQVSANTHSAYSSDDIHLTVESCYFDVNLDMQSSSSNAAAAILFSRVIGAAKVEITAKNTYFKGTFNTKNGAGASGAIYGRRWSEGSGVVPVNVENCIFDVTSATNKKGAVVGDYRSATATTITATGTNLIYGGEGKVATVANEGTYEGFTIVAEGDNTVTTVKGYQTTTAVDNKFDLRLVGLVELGDTALTDYSKVGFVVVANYANTNTKCTTAASNKVYNSITENTATSTNALTATELGGDYIYALAIKNIPANAGDVTFTVTPYYVAADGTTVVYGANTVFTVDVSELPTDTLDVAA